MFFLRLQPKFAVCILVHAKLRKEFDGLVGPHFVSRMLLEKLHDLFPAVPDSGDKMSYICVCSRTADGVVRTRIEEQYEILTQ